MLDLIPTQPGVQSSDFYMLEAGEEKGRVRACVAANAVANVILGGTGEWPYKEPFFLERRVFASWAGVAKEIRNKAEFEFTDNGGALVVVHGGRRLVFNSQAAVVGYARLAKLKTPSKLALTPEILSLIECANTCAASEMQAPELACVYMLPTERGVKLLASNQKVVFRAFGTLAEPLKGDLPFPAEMMAVARADGLKSLLWSEGCVVGRFANGYVWQSVQEKAATEFPVKDIESLIKQSKTEETNVFKVSAYKFAKLVARLCLYLQSVKKEDWVMTVAGARGGGELLVAAKLPQCTIKERIKLMEPARRDFRMDWPLEMLAPVFSFIGQEDEERPLVVGLSKDKESSYVGCGRIEMVVPAQLS